MHKSSYKKMQYFREKYLTKLESKVLNIIDLGSQNVNGTYKDIFNRDQWKYQGLDITAGNNVDIVIDDIYSWEKIEDNSIDILISGQAFEHIEFIWQSIREVERVLKPGGLCCIIAPSSGYEHRYPVDCWRFYPDGFKALAKWGRLKVLESFTQWDDEGYSCESDLWHDSVLIAQKPIQQPKYILKNKPLSPIAYNAIECSTFFPNRIMSDHWTGHTPFLHQLLIEMKPDTYVELGTYQGDSYFTACQTVKEHQLSTLCYAIDSWEGDQHVGQYNSEIYNDISNYNYLNYSKFSKLIKSKFSDALTLFKDCSIDLLHIDGYHTYEAVKNDFQQWYPKVKEGGIILFHDISAKQADFGVWKFWEEIEQEYQTFQFTHSWGLGILKKKGDLVEPGETVNTLLNDNHKKKESLVNHFLLNASVIKEKRCNNDLNKKLLKISNELTKQQESYNRLYAKHQLHESSLLQAYLKQLCTDTWNKYKTIALYGAGDHTTWLLSILAEDNIPSFIIDDNYPEERFKGIPVIRVENALNVEAVIISSDCHNVAMKEKLTSYTLLKNIAIIDPYKNLPQGPYIK
jgi:hypothetical protein